MNTDPAPSKIFGVGLNKTGTTTLGLMGRVLGLRCKSCDRGLLEDFVVRKDFTRIEETVRDHDLFEDWPWPLIYRDLDRMYPGSKFILTARRSPEAWLESLKKHSMRTHPTRHHRKLAYGFPYPHGRERDHLEFYRRHNDEVRAYFEGRRENFIELCWEKGDGFRELCGFLGCEVPDTPMPHANRGADKPVRLTRLLANRFMRAFR